MNCLQNENEEERTTTEDNEQPLISTFSPYRDLPSATPKNLPNANKLADEVICLPIHHALTEEDVERVIKILKI